MTKEQDLKIFQRLRSNVQLRPDGIQHSLLFSGGALLHSFFKSLNHLVLSQLQATKIDVAMNVCVVETRCKRSQPTEC